MSINLDPSTYPHTGDIIVGDIAPARPPAVLYTPEWWRDRLVDRLARRATEADRYQAFYDGVQRLAFASDKFADVFGRRYADLPANFMPLVVDAERERMIVQGFRFGQTTDKSAWAIWQRNQLDAESQIAHEIALVKGLAYAMVWPGPDGVEITIEDPSEVIVETAPGNRRRRLAALKVWFDDDGYLRAYLYLPDAIYKWRSIERRTEDRGSWTLQRTRWEPYTEADEDFPVKNPVGLVPVIPLLNRPRRNGMGRSEIAPVMGNQNAINKLRFDALVASEFVAFPQRWVTNIDIPVDPDTGKQVSPFRPGVDNLWAVRRPTPEEQAEYGDKPPEAAFGQFPAADLRPYFSAIEAEVGAMSSISRTPYHYFLGTPTSIPPSGESLKSSEAPLVKKVVAQSIHFGEGWEETMRVALLVEGQTSKARTDGETIWADPETRNEAARTDSILKQYQAGLLPDEFALEELGYSQQQIARIAELRAAEPLPPAEPTADDVLRAAGIPTIGASVA